jgi:hypothetical protein
MARHFSRLSQLIYAVVQQKRQFGGRIERRELSRPELK